MRKFKFDYDSENDDLFLYDPRSKSKGSVEIGDIILDYNTQKRLVGIELMNASNLLQEFTEENGVGDVLRSLKECRVGVSSKGNLAIIKLGLVGKSKEISSVISVPTIEESSPALRY